MTKITMDVSEEEYRDSKSASGENRDEAIRVVGWRAMDAYEAEQNKIGPGDWVKMNDSGEILLCSELDDSDDLPEKGFYSEPDSNLWLPIKAATKLSPEAQDILNKETGQGEEIHLNMCNIHGFKISQGGSCHICDLERKDIVQGEG